MAGTSQGARKAALTKNLSGSSLPEEKHFGSNEDPYKGKVHIPFSEKYAKASGTSDGAVKAWKKRKRGGGVDITDVNKRLTKQGFTPMKKIKGKDHIDGNWVHKNVPKILKSKFVKKELGRLSYPDMDDMDGQEWEAFADDELAAADVIIDEISRVTGIEDQDFLETEILDEVITIDEVGTSMTNSHARNALIRYGKMVKGENNEEEVPRKIPARTITKSGNPQDNVPRITKSGTTYEGSLMKELRDDIHEFYTKTQSYDKVLSELKIKSDESEDPNQKQEYITSMEKLKLKHGIAERRLKQAVREYRKLRQRGEQESQRSKWLLENVAKMSLVESLIARENALSDKDMKAKLLQNFKRETGTSLGFEDWYNDYMKMFKKATKEDSSWYNKYYSNWQTFHMNDRDKKDYHATCKICGANISNNASMGGKFFTHLRKKHNIQIQEKLDTIYNKSREWSSTGSLMPNQATARKKTAQASGSSSGAKKGWRNRRKNIYHDRLDRGLYPNPNTVEPYPADPKIRKKKKAQASGTSVGAIKAWKKRKRGGGSDEEIFKTGTLPDGTQVVDPTRFKKMIRDRKKELSTGKDWTGAKLTKRDMLRYKEEIALWTDKFNKGMYDSSGQSLNVVNPLLNPERSMKIANKLNKSLKTRGISRVPALTISDANYNKWTQWFNKNGEKLLGKSDITKIKQMDVDLDEWDASQEAEAYIADLILNRLTKHFNASGLTKATGEDDMDEFLEYMVGTVFDDQGDSGVQYNQIANNLMYKYANVYDDEDDFDDDD